MRRLLLLSVIALGLAGAGCATDRQSSTDTSAPKTVKPDLSSTTQLQGRSRAGGMFDNQVQSASNPMTPGATGMPTTSFQRYDQMQNRSFGMP